MSEYEEKTSADNGISAKIKADTNKISAKTFSYESAYPIDELIKADLGSKPLIAKAALKLAGKPEYTIREAKKIVLEFKKEADK